MDSVNIKTGKDNSEEFSYTEYSQEAVSHQRNKFAKVKYWITNQEEEVPQIIYWKYVKLEAKFCKQKKISSTQPQ